MIYYAAVVNKAEIAAVTVTPPFNILASFHYYKKKSDEIKGLLTRGVSIFLDSGAFSSESSGKPIDIDDYIAFIKETGVKVYAGLDVIGDAAASMRNQKYMEQAGLQPIPTFHMGSALEDLKPLLEEYSYIAIGGVVHSAGVEEHCDAVWNYILNNKPSVKVHGFGLTNYEFMQRYPWYSIDSSSFKRLKRFGHQNILYGDFKFHIVREPEYKRFLQTIGYKVDEMTNQELWFAYDYHSVQCYKQYAAYLTERNKRKDFSELSAQKTLFD